MAQTETTTTDSTDHNEMGAAGWFSAAGFVIMGLLYVLEVAEVADSILSPIWTLVIALLAGVGAVLFYYGDDPTA